MIAVPELEKDEDGRELCPYCGWILNTDPKECPKCREKF
jgi:rubrerythrin